MNEIDMIRKRKRSWDEEDSGPKLLPKHDIFLCHSGIQKNFTERLEIELKRCDYTSFFDVLDDSIPKGESFAECIFSAASQCGVAILILSDDFFTNSKWPMLELAAFVDAQKKSKEMGLPERPVILPVYYQLTSIDCEDSLKRSEWLSTWKEWERVERELTAEKGVQPIDVQKWKLALDAFRSSSGIEHNEKTREAGLIGKVVEAVRHLLPPPIFGSDASIHGKGRIRKTIKKNIKQSKSSWDGARVVGVHGMAGTGKTTFCKELRYRYYEKFEGKVFHAELGSKSEIEAQRDVVRTLTNVNHVLLSKLEGLKVTEHLQHRMEGERVFLALDNVWQESIDEAMVYMQAKYGPNSIVLVTARSIDILKSLQIKESDCLEMPELEEEDARQLFLSYAAPGIQLSRFQSDKDKRSIDYCIKECHFSKGGDKGECYHPLALKVLGSQLKRVGCNPENWVESLKDGSKFDQDCLKVKKLFPFLGRGYCSKKRLISEEDDPFLFMDVALFKDVVFWSPGSRCIQLVTHFEWLSMVHKTDMATIKKRLQVLKERAVLEFVGIGAGCVFVHDLYREFARFEANRGKLWERGVMWHEGREAFKQDFEMTPSAGPDGCWRNVERLGVVVKDEKSFNVGGVKWQNFANVVVLVLRSIERNQELHLERLQGLRSLTLVGSDIRVIGLGKLRNLRWLDLDGICCGHHEFGDLTELKVLRVITKCDCVRMASPPLELANLDKCIELLELVLESACLEALPDLSRMTALRRAFFKCPNATEGPVLGSGMRCSAGAAVGEWHISMLSPLSG